MRVVRERKQVITIELGLAEAMLLRDQIEGYCGIVASGCILEELRKRLEYHVAKAIGDRADES